MDNTTKKPSIYDMLGLTPERGIEIAEDVTDMMFASDNLSDAFLNIAKKYDGESVLAGIRFEFLLNISKQKNTIVERTAKRQNTPMN